MDSLHQPLPRVVPLARCGDSFGEQSGPQCKIYALAIVHRLLCACGQLLPYKNGNSHILSARKIAKSCGSAVGEITSPELFQKVASLMGMDAKVCDYQNLSEMLLLFDRAFQVGCYVIVFVQMDRDTNTYPAASDCHDQWLEHAIVVSGWSPETLEMAKAEGDIGRLEFSELAVSCFDRSGDLIVINLSEIYHSSCQVITQRKPERFYKHLTIERHLTDLTIKDSWLGICGQFCQERDACHWHDFDQHYQHYLKLRVEQFPDLNLSCDPERLFKQAKVGLIPSIYTRESSSSNGSFRKKMAIVSLKSTDQASRTFINENQG